MYNQKETNELQQLTKEWLSLIDKESSKAKAVNLIEVLRNILRFHEYRYYVQNDPLISDFEYDSLYKFLEKIEKENPSLISRDSPTQRVGTALVKDFPKVEHLVPMLSLGTVTILKIYWTGTERQGSFQSWK